MTMREVLGEGQPGAFGAIRRRPTLFVILSLLAFAGILIFAKSLLQPSGIEVRLRTEIIDLAIGAESPASLIRPLSLDADRLRTRISAASSTVIDSVEQRPPSVNSGDGYDHFLIRLTSNDEPFAGGMQTGNDHLLEPITAFISRENRRRSVQRRDAAAWVDRQITLHHTRIDDTKEVILQSPLEADQEASKARSGSETLLRLFIDATVEVKQAGVRQAADDGQLDRDLARMATAFSSLETDHAVVIEYGAALRDAEDALAELRGEAAQLLNDDGILARPAAERIGPVSPAPIALSPPWPWAAPFPAYVEKWMLLLPLAALSLIIALIGVIVVSRLQPSPVIAADDYINDPNWPLPRGAHRDLPS